MERRFRHAISADRSKWSGASDTRPICATSPSGNRSLYRLPKPWSSICRPISPLAGNARRGDWRRGAYDVGVLICIKKCLDGQLSCTRAFRSASRSAKCHPFSVSPGVDALLRGFHPFLLCRETANSRRSSLPDWFLRCVGLVAKVCCVDVEIAALSMRNEAANVIRTTPRSTLLVASWSNKSLCRRDKKIKWSPGFKTRPG